MTNSGTPRVRYVACVARQIRQQRGNGPAPGHPDGTWTGGARGRRESEDADLGLRSHVLAISFSLVSW